MNENTTSHLRIYTCLDAFTAAVQELGCCLEALEGDPSKVAETREVVVQYIDRGDFLSFSSTSGKSSMTIWAAPKLELRILTCVLASGDLNLCLDYLQSIDGLAQIKEHLRSIDEPSASEEFERLWSKPTIESDGVFGDG